MLEKFLILLCGILIGQRVRIGGDASVKRQRFRSYLVVFRAKIDAKAADDFVFSQELRDVDTLEAESLEVRHYIVRRLLGQFDAAIRDYKSARFDQWAGSDPKRQQERDASNHKAKAQLICSLDTLYRCAWWAV
ncbi:MAG: hypothetical protein U1G08_06955 [Verrucomicrobiota bacterium]